MKNLIFGGSCSCYRMDGDDDKPAEGGGDKPAEGGDDKPETPST